jgi:glycogen operon protein
MLLMGDEVRRSQGGNNNGFCQDNETSWFDWAMVEKHAEIHRFAKALIALRKDRHLPIERFKMTLSELLSRQPFQWHGVKLNAPDWGYESHTLAATIPLLGYRSALHVIVNAYWEPLEFEIPPLDEPQESWRRLADTSLDPPDDIREWADAPTAGGPTYRAGSRSVVLLFARTGD